MEEDQRITYMQSLNPNQHCRLRRGDRVTYFDFDLNDWLRVKIIYQSKATSKYQDYYNFSNVLGRPKDGMYFDYGGFWLI